MLTTPAGWLLPLAVLAPFVGLLAGLSAQAGGKFLQTILVCLAGGLLALGLRGRPMPVRAGAALPLHRATAAAGGTDRMGGRAPPALADRGTRPADAGRRLFRQYAPAKLRAADVGTAVLVRPPQLSQRRVSRATVGE